MPADGQLIIISLILYLPLPFLHSTPQLQSPIIFGSFMYMYVHIYVANKLAHAHQPTPNQPKQFYSLCYFLQESINNSISWLCNIDLLLQFIIQNSFKKSQAAAVFN
jgi:hypothetical protein